MVSERIFPPYYMLIRDSHIVLYHFHEVCFGEAESNGVRSDFEGLRQGHSWFGNKQDLD